MLEESLIEFCSPTLAGLKTGSLVSCLYLSREQTSLELSQLNQTFIPKGLCVLPLRYCNGRVLIYQFRPVQLKMDLSRIDAARVLSHRISKHKSTALSLGADTKAEQLRRLSA